MQRRRLLKLVGIMGTSGLAGCSSQDSSSGSNGSNNGMTGGSGETTGTTIGEMTSPTANRMQTSASMGRTTSQTSDGMETATTGGMDGREMNDSGGMSGGNRNPKAGQIAYKSVGIGVDFSSPTKATVKFKLPEPVQCSIAYGESSEYGTLRADLDMSGPAKRHRIPITTSAGTTYNARLNLFDNALNALQTPNFTFSAPDSGSATRSTKQRLTYVETEMAEKRFVRRPNLNIDKHKVTVTYRTKTPVLGAVQFQQGKTSTTRRDVKGKPHTNHAATINGLQNGTQTQWAVGLVAPDTSMYTTVGMAFQTK